MNKGSNRINDNDDNEGESFDTVEQDSLETTKADAIKTGDGATQFLPFAHIGTSWSNECAAQISTAQFNSNTNQNVEIESTNQTNEIDVQTNNSITTKQSIEHDFQDLPGIKCQTNCSEINEINFVDVVCLSFCIDNDFIFFLGWVHILIILWPISGSIAEREHMKWKNAVEMENNPYSAEALQRRLSQSTNTKFIDIERLTSKFETKHMDSKPLSPSNKTDKPIKVVLGSNKVNPERFVHSDMYSPISFDLIVNFY